MLRLVIPDMHVSSASSLVNGATRMRLVLLAIVSLIIIYYMRYLGHPRTTFSPVDPIPHLSGESTAPSSSSPPPTHPIDHLIAEADDHFNRLLKKETKTLQSAAAAYRERRGRNPPPGFDGWFRYAEERGAVMVEDFFDQIYHDLEPFWGLEPATIRRESVVDNMVITVRNGKAHTDSDWFWTTTWADMIKSIEEHLPDVDVPVNPMDESRLMVPWEDVAGYLEKAKASKRAVSPDKVISTFQNLPPPGEHDLNVTVREKSWELKGSAPFWDIMKRGCPPDSLARAAEAVTDFTRDADITSNYARAHMTDGFILNYTLSTDYCHQPDLQTLHGTIISPLTVSSTKVLTPLFGGSKLLTNNEILLPPPMHWGDHDDFMGKGGLGIPWAEKHDSIIWRGVSSGGWNCLDNWKGFQRHRFMSMTNTTKVALAEDGQRPANWALPQDEFEVLAQQEGSLAEWVAEWSNTGFTSMNCYPDDVEDPCAYITPHFSTKPEMAMADQFMRKYLPDIDGNSFSGRFRGFLLSGSLPIKATIYREWHDSRLVPWKHFVPMDNRFLDFFAIMQYFLGYDGARESAISHDAVARKIALAGQAWAGKVLRNEDMQIYVYRLLLEYARVCDDRREVMGWVQDLLD